MISVASRSFRSCAEKSSSVAASRSVSSLCAFSLASRSRSSSVVRRSRCVSRAPALSRSTVIISSRECTVSSISSCVGVIASSGTSSSSFSVFPFRSFRSRAPTRARVASSRSSTNLLLSDTSSFTRICVSIRSSCVSRSSVWSDAWKESCALGLPGSTIPATTVCVALSTLRAPPCFLGDSRCAAADVASAILPSAVSALSDVRIKSSTRTHCFGSLFSLSLRADERLCFFFPSDGSFGIVASSAVWSSPLSRARVSEDRRPCAPRSSEWWLPRRSSLAMLSARRGASP
mmetsp:Transcript_7496/g.31924  ORF Transcript_7496/g.31924 Transcript_7496/m.31924 type:complete len:290 (+) Transcript_7496:1253-2122(+)